MKPMHLLFGIIIVFLLGSNSYAQLSQDKDYRKFNSSIHSEIRKSFYEIKTEIIKEMNFKPLLYKSNVSAKDTYIIIGAAAFAGFILSVTIFNEEIFSTLPLTLFGASVLFIILGS
jgi:hypothetical protein